MQLSDNQPAAADVHLSWWVSLVVCIGASMYPFAAAVPAPPAARIVMVKGVATAQPGDAAPRVLAAGSPVFSGETLTTGKDPSHAVVAFTDGTRFTLRPNTTIRIDDYAFDADSGRAIFTLKKGGLRVATGKISARQADQFRIHTPYGELAVPPGTACTDGCDVAPIERANSVPGTNGSHTQHPIPPQ